MTTSPILVTGGTGRLGRRVVARLVDSGCDVRILARRERGIARQVRFFTGDLRRGEGIDPAVRGVGTIIHCATSTKGDADATRNPVMAAVQAGSPYLLCPSIVGIDRLASWGYTKTKLEVERIVEDSGLPWTILRITQFYDYCFDNSRKLSRFPVLAPVPDGFTVQPVDPTRWQPVSSSSLLASLSAVPLTWPARKYRVGRICSAAYLNATIATGGWSQCGYWEARPSETVLFCHRRGTPSGPRLGTSSLWRS